VSVTLTSSSDTSATFTPQLTDGTNGSYSFTGLTAGTYVLTATFPTNLTDGRAILASGVTNGKPAGVVISDITLLSGASASGYNFTADGLTTKYISADLFFASAPTISDLLNQTPTIMGLSTAQTPSQAAQPLAIPFSLSDSLVPTSSLNVVGSSSNPDDVVHYTGTGSDRTLTVIPSAGDTTPATITTTVTDPYGNVSTAAFSLTVSSSSASSSVTPAAALNVVGQSPASSAVVSDDASSPSTASTSAADSLFSQIGSADSSTSSTTPVAALDAALASQDQWT
jgi:hypothetical protein